MGACSACDGGERSSGVLCADCVAKIATTNRLLPEQVLATAIRPADAVLIDQWGRPHALEASTTIGRQPRARGVTVLDVSISRNHASLERDDNGAWSMRDLQSANGSFARGDQVTDAVPLASGDVVTFANVSFFFVTPAVQLPAAERGIAAVETVRPDSHATLIRQQDAGEEDTFPGLPEVSMALVEPTGGGGGFLEFGDKRVQLSLGQFELLSLLAERMLADKGQPELVRGFLRTTEIISHISWDSNAPEESHVKQLIRRVRRLLVGAGIGNLIEGRRQLGYRLRVVPLQPAR